MSIANRKMTAPTPSISITSGRMKLILCSFVVLVSTSKPQNMSSKVHLVLELDYDIDILITFLSVPTLFQILNFAEFARRYGVQVIHNEICNGRNPFKISRE